MPDRVCVSLIPQSGSKKQDFASELVYCHAYSLGREHELHWQQVQMHWLLSHPLLRSKN